jgi:Domain of unknown function (DUF3303)
MLYMIIEDFRDGDPLPVYRRLRDSGREMPQGLSYIASWVSSDLTRCYQVMECADRSPLEEWMSRWADLVRFEVVPVMDSSEAAALVADRL